VYINNVKQEEGSGKSYTASGTTITFSEAVASGDSCYLVYMGLAMGTITAPDGSIVSAQLANANLEMPNTLDMNGKELILDADADTSITADTDDQIDIKIGGSDKITINSSGRVGVGTTDIDAPIDIVDSTEYVRISNTVSDDTTKTGGLAVRHRDNEEEDVNVINGVAGSSDNLVNIGGSDFIGNLNAATKIAFFTAADRTTLTGTNVGGVGTSVGSSNLLWYFYLTSSDNNYVMNVNPHSSVGAGLWNAYFKADSAVFTGYHYYAKKNPTILYTEEDTIPSGKKVGDVKTQGETFEMGDVIVYENGKVTKCTKAHATNVVGIYSGHPMPGGRWLSNNKDDIATEEHALEVASVGDSQDWNKTVTHYLSGFKVCNENGAIASGDLLCSASKTGYLMKQDGTTITTETVGKSMDDVTFESDGTATGIYGFLYCG